MFVIMICIAFLFSYAPRPCTDVEILANSTCTGFGGAADFIGDITGNPSDAGSFYDNFYGQLAIAGATAVAISIFFPNPYTIFAAFAIFLLAFATIPYEIIVSSASYGFGPNDPLLLLIAAVFGIMFIVAAVAWYKGNDW